MSQQNSSQEAPPTDHTDQTSPASRVVRSYPQLPFAAIREHLQQQQQQQQQHQQQPHHPHLPLPEREDSSSNRPRTITFGTLKKASMTNRGSLPSSTSAGVATKRSKLVTLPSYFRHTTFKQHFQPEGVALGPGGGLAGGFDQGLDVSSFNEREPSKRRRLHTDSGTRRRHTHFHRDSDDSSISSSGSSSGSSGSSSGSESGNSSCENDSGTSTPRPERRPSLRYQLPSRWSKADKTDKTELSEDDLQVHYTGPGKADSDASAIRANRPIPPQCGVYYYEVLIKSKGQQGYIGVGVCNASVALDRLPGWEPLSWGYHGDDGNSFGGCGNGRPFGPIFTTGDTIGCGVNFRDMSLFYTKNGVYLGVAFRDVKGPLYPTVGMRTAGEIIEANFGQQEFVFNIEDYVKDEKVSAWQTLENTLTKSIMGDKHHVNTLSQSLSHLVLSYMIHQGYSESAKQFSSDLAPEPMLQRNQDSSAEGSSSTMEDSSLTELNQYSAAIVDSERRKVIRKAIMSGEIDEAIGLLEEHYPGIMSDNEDMVLQLRCRKFVELVHLSSLPLRSLDHSNWHEVMADHISSKKNGHNGKDAVQDAEMKDAALDSDAEFVDVSAPDSTDVIGEASTEDMDVDQDLEGLGTLKEAIHYGQFLQEQYKDNKRQSVQDMLIDAFAVLAYSEQTDHTSSNGSGSGHHHHQQGTKPISREKVASTVNSAILATQNLPTTAPLETVYRQTSVVMSTLTRLGVGEAAFFDLDEDCLE